MTRPNDLLTSMMALAALGLTSACSSSDGSDEGTPGGDDPTAEACADESHVRNADGECILDPLRFEPDEQVDINNVVFNGEMLPYNTELPLDILTDLPEPPKSGFRLVMTPRDIPPGYDSESGRGDGYSDISPCQSWPVPDIGDRWVYTATVHTTPGLHHANLYGLGIDAEAGPQPYPNCRGSADMMVFGQIPRAISNPLDPTLFVPEVLFANSTQVIGVNAEQYALADGYAYHVPAGFEVATDTHLQNTTPEALHVEAAWDFYTMPADLVTNPAAMFVFIHFGFNIAPRSTEIVHGNCDWGGGEVLAIMPHTHQWATQFTTHFGSAPGPDGTIAKDLDAFIPSITPYDRRGTGLTDSDVEVYDPPIATDGMDAVQFQCHFNNTTDHSMRFGVGENEMCFLFGYASPIEAQRVGIMTAEDADCLSLAPQALRAEREAAQQ